MSESAYLEEPYWKHGQEDIVMSGISVRLPESDSIKEFGDRLLAGEDLITYDDRRYTPGIYGLPKGHGKIKSPEKFDANFFAVPPVQANKMDPQLRFLLETCFEAILDAGYNPQDFRGSNTGVFVGTSASETASYLTTDPDDISGYVLTGTVRSMFANRVSYQLDLRGPSFAVDTACSSSMLAFQLAVDAIRSDQCDAALVCGSHFTLTPVASLQFLRLGMLSPTSSCKSFDDSGDGYARAEGVGAIFLQRASAARRVLATVANAKSATDGYKEQGVTFPSGARQAELLEQVYREAGLNPAQVSYVECHGTGTKVGDPQEAGAITDVFCRNRQGPLLIGSVKSNMGHAEPSSGIASLAKVVVAMERGIIPPNLHYSTPNPYIPALADGRLQVVTKATPWKGGYVGINSFGFGGSNTHVALKSNDISAVKTPRTSFPKLVCASGRTKEGVDVLLGEVERHPDDAHFHSLVGEISTVTPNLFPYRGYTLLHRTHTNEPLHEVLKVGAQNERRPIWFVYSGMGSHWVGMAKDMMQIDLFKASILKVRPSLPPHIGGGVGIECSDTLGPYGVDPYAILVRGADDAFKDTLSAMVCITAVQLALTDVVRAVGLEPDGLIGHSTGEIGAGYGDGCLSKEEAILLAYHRGKAVVSTDLPPGAMAAVGLSWAQALARCPPGVIPACHNGPDSVTVSGPIHAVHQMKAELEADGVFCKLVQSQNIAFHSPDMKRVEDKMRAAFTTVLPQPRKRSPRWISSSVKESEWDSELGRHVSAEYHVHNALNPVLFYEGLLKIPENAITIELAPHALLLSVLRRSLPSTVTSIGLMKAKEANNVEHCLAAIGKLHCAGASVNWGALYPAVSYPVPRGVPGTPSLSSLIRWDHSNDFFTVDGKQLLSNGGGIATSSAFRVDPFTSDSHSRDAYLLDHVVDGRVLYPFTAHLVLAWKTLAKIQGLDFEKTPVVLEEVHVYRPTIVNKAVKFDVCLVPNTGHFEIIEDGQLTASGIIKMPEENRPFFYDELEKSPFPLNPERVVLDNQDIYKEFLLRGYEYGPHFRGIYNACNSGDRGTLYWTGNWVTFLDSLLQTALLAEKGDSLRLPTRLRYLRIDPVRHLSKVTERDDLEVVDLRNDLATRGCIAGGIEVCDLSAQSVQRRLHSTGRVVLEKIFFVPHHDDAALQRWPGLREEVAEYTALCQRQLLAVLNKWGPSVIKSLPNAPQLIEAAHTLSKSGVREVRVGLAEAVRASLHDSTALYRLLLRLEEESGEGVAGVMGEWASALEGDAVWSGSWTQECAKALWDMVFENQAGHSFSIAAIYPSTLSVINMLRKMQLTHPLLEATYYILQPEQTHSEEDLQAQGYIYHKMDMQRGDKLPEGVKEADGAVLDRVLSRCVDPDRFLHNAKKALRDDGFFLVSEPTRNLHLQAAIEALRPGVIEGSGDGSRTCGLYLSQAEWEQKFAENGLLVVGHQTDPALSSTLFLLRKTPSIPRSPSFIPCDDVSDFSWIEPLKTLWEDKLTAGDEETIWITSTETRDNGLSGLSLCLREESTRFNRFRSVVDASVDKATTHLNMGSEEMQQIIHEDLHANVYRDGRWGSFRHFVVQEEKMHEFCETEHAYINTVVRGDLGSLSWVQSPNAYWSLSPRRLPAHSLLSVYYAALNFRDVMLASGRLPPDAIPGDFPDRDCLLGMEYAGRLPDGERRMGILPAQALATTLVSHPDFSWPVPAHWTMREAATVPVVYCTAYYALIVRGSLRKGQRVLIHSGSGGVGQAAIAIALSLHCTVFTTVGSPEKRAFLLQRFPQLRDEHIANSRSTDFEWNIRHGTQGRGVDIVLNSLSEDKLQASVRCLATHGKFLEIGKFDLSNNSNLGMAVFLKNVTFHGILLDSLMEDADNPDWLQTATLLKRGIRDGTVRPLPSTLFTAYQAEEAFRYMAQGKHIGKVLMEVRPEDTGNVVPRPIKVRAVRRSYCHPQRVYLITGGLGGFGLELATWLILRGATKLVLTSRSGVRTGYQARCLYFWRRMGIQVAVSTHDLSQWKGAAGLMEMCREMGPIGGVFHLAMILRDCLFENQNVNNFKEAAAAKYYGTKNLDQASRAVCGPELQWFVCFSSITSGRGNAGQTNYGWANATMERIVDQRRFDGLPGMAIQWGAIGDVGVILENMGDNHTVVGGTLPQRMPSCLQALDSFLCWDTGIVSSFIRAETGEATASSSADVVQAIAHILGVNDVSQLDPNATLGDLGLDSLMGVEIKQALERDYNLVMSMKDIRNLTMNKLKNLNTLGASESEGSGDAAAAPNALASIASMSKESLESLETQMTSIFKLRVNVDDLFIEKAVVRVNSAEVRAGAPVVFFAPSIEGIGSPLEKLASMLSVPAFCFQFNPDVPRTSVVDVAARYIHVMKEIQPEGPYNIVGYSYGACVAFDMACQLQKASVEESADSVGNLMLLDGSHKYMETYKMVYRRTFGVKTPDLRDDPIFQTELLCAFCLRFTSINYPAMRRELMLGKSWEERVGKATSLVEQAGMFSRTETIALACQGIYDEFVMADRYAPTYKFKGDITLIRAETGAAREEDVGRDYGVGEGVEVTSRVDVHVVPGDHDSFVSGATSSITASIIGDVLASAPLPATQPSAVQELRPRH